MSRVQAVYPCSALSVEPKYMTTPTGRYIWTSPCCNLTRSYESRFGASLAACSTTVRIPDSIPNQYRRMVRLAQESERAILSHADTHRTSLDDIARAQAVIPTSPSTHSGLTIKEQMSVRARGAQNRASRGPKSDLAWRSASCATSQHPACHDDQMPRRARQIPPPPRRTSLLLVAAPNLRGTGRWKCAQRVTGPLPHATEYQRTLFF